MGDLYANVCVCVCVCVFHIDETIVTVEIGGCDVISMYVTPVLIRLWRQSQTRPCRICGSCRLWCHLCVTLTEMQNFFLSLKFYSQPLAIQNSFFRHFRPKLFPSVSAELFFTLENSVKYLPCVRFSLWTNVTSFHTDRQQVSETNTDHRKCKGRLRKHAMWIS